MFYQLILNSVAALCWNSCIPTLAEDYDIPSSVRKALTGYQGHTVIWNDTGIMGITTMVNCKLLQRFSGLQNLMFTQHGAVS